MFAATKRWTAAVALINTADAAPYKKILARLLKALPEKRGSSFSDDELVQLREAFGLGEAELELLLGLSAFVFEQAAYATTPPETLRTELLDAGLAEEHALAFCSVWQAGAAECVQALKERSVLAPSSLAAVDWQLCVGTADSNGGRTPAAYAMLELELATAVPEGKEVRTPVHARLSIDEMAGLLRKLDTVQGQMDRLS